MLVALFAVAAGLTVTWYTAQFASLALLQQWAGLAEAPAKALVAAGIALAAPVFVVCGWLSDRVGRRPLLLTGYVLSLALTIPLSQHMGALANPARVAAAERAPIVVAGSHCEYAVFSGRRDSECGRILQYFSSKGVPYRVVSTDSPTPDVRIGAAVITGADLPTFAGKLAATGYFSPPALDVFRASRVVLIVAALATFSALIFGQSAALLVELFAARVRYTSLSIPYHLGTGYFGGFRPFIAQYIVTRTGNPYAGLYNTLAVVGVALLVCVLFLPETRHRDIRT